MTHKLLIFCFIITGTIMLSSCASYVTHSRYGNGWSLNLDRGGSEPDTCTRQKKHARHQHYPDTVLVLVADTTSGSLLSVADSSGFTVHNDTAVYNNLLTDMHHSHSHKHRIHEQSLQHQNTIKTTDKKQQKISVSIHHNDWLRDLANGLLITLYIALVAFGIWALIFAGGWLFWLGIGLLSVLVLLPLVLLILIINSGGFSGFTFNMKRDPAYTGLKQHAATENEVPSSQNKKSDTDWGNILFWTLYPIVIACGIVLLFIDGWLWLGILVLSLFLVIPVIFLFIAIVFLDLGGIT